MVSTMCRKQQHFGVVLMSAIPRGTQGWLTCVCLLIAACVTSCVAVDHQVSQRVATRPRDLRGLAKLYGFAGPIARRDGLVTLKGRYTTVLFETDSRRFYLNGTLFWMHRPLTKSGNKWVLLPQDMRDVIEPLMRPDKALARQGYKVVVLDPGHGGDDAGAIGNRGVPEKRLVLDIARRVRAKLGSLGVRARMTRERDRSLSLNQRVDLAKSWKADLYVSIHLNHAAVRSARGVETFVLTSPGCASTLGTAPSGRIFAGNWHCPASTLLARYVHEELVAHTDAYDRGVKRARFRVLRNTDCPAVLVECGFLSNTEEERNFLGFRYKNRVAEGIAEGILTYVRKTQDAHAALDRRSSGRHSGR